MNEWLENFTYRRTVDVCTYVISLVIVMVTVAVTIGYQAVKASIANPVSSLRSE